MTAIEHEGVIYRPESAVRRGLRNLRARMGLAGGAALATAATTVAGIVAAKAAPSVRQVKEHAYSILGFMCFDGAMFYHSVFTGLLVTGISLFVFEWKVSDDATER